MKSKSEETTKPSLLMASFVVVEILEQDHRNLAKITRATLGCKSFHTANRTIKGREIQHAIA